MIALPLFCSFFVVASFLSRRATAHLSGGIPQLKADDPVVEIHGLGQEVDTDRRLKSETVSLFVKDRFIDIIIIRIVLLKSCC